MRNKKTLIAIISVVAVVLVLIGVTYAYWLVTKEQQGENVISSACLDISLNGSGDINLPDQYPMSDEEGLKTTPYIFTVTNNCNTSIDYQINLETLGSEENTIIPSAIKVSLNDNKSLLSENGEVTPTLSDAFTARKLLVGTLSSASTTNNAITYNLRLWIDKDAPISEQNKTFRSKITVTIGQGVNNSLKEGTLAYEIIANSGDNYKNLSTKYQLNENGMIGIPAESGDITFGTGYNLNQDTGEITLTGNLVTASLEECVAGQKADGTKISCGSYVLYDESARILLKLKSFDNFNGDYLDSYQYISANSFDSGVMPKEELFGIYKTQDDLGDSYIFRGDLGPRIQLGQVVIPTTGFNLCPGWDCSEPWETFDTEAECELENERYATEEDITDLECKPNGGTYDLYWDVFRINGDGSIRIMLSWTDFAMNYNDVPVRINDTSYNNSYSDAKYVGYTYNNNGVETDSEIKKALEDWYETNLEKDFGKYIADGIFCNDRTPGANSGYYAAYDRINSENPTLKCSNKDDRYTVSASLGNGLLTKPIGLITADELMIMAYFNKNWEPEHPLGFYALPLTMTPSKFLNNKAYIYKGGSDAIVNTTGAIITPVINLKADVKFTDQGWGFTLVED